MLIRTTDGVRSVRIEAGDYILWDPEIGTISFFRHNERDSAELRRHGPNDADLGDDKYYVGSMSCGLFDVTARIVADSACLSVSPLQVGRKIGYVFTRSERIELNPSSAGSWDVRRGGKECGRIHEFPDTEKPYSAFALIGKLIGDYPTLEAAKDAILQYIETASFLE